MGQRPLPTNHRKGRRTKYPPTAALVATDGGREGMGGGGRASAPDKFTGNERAARYGDGGAVSQISVTGPECAVRAARAVARARAGPSETQRRTA